MKLLLFIVPLLLMVLWSLASGFLIKFLDNALLKSLVLTVGGIIVSIIMILFIRFISNKAGLPAMNLGTFRGFMGGLCIGLSASILSAFLFWATQKPTIQKSSVSEKMLASIVVNISPALVEEISFRGSIVHYSNLIWGSNVGLAAGSIPFGLIHLLSRLLGMPVGFWHVVGVSAAGLLLSLCYLKFGLLFAVALHWIWNSLLIIWINLFGLPKSGGVQILEGAWTTTMVLLLLSLLIFQIFPAKPLSV